MAGNANRFAHDWFHSLLAFQGAKSWATLGTFYDEFQVFMWMWANLNRSPYNAFDQSSFPWLVYTPPPVPVAPYKSSTWNDSFNYTLPVPEGYADGGVTYRPRIVAALWSGDSKSSPFSGLYPQEWCGTMTGIEAANMIGWDFAR